MKKNLTIMATVFLLLAIISCGSKKETASSVAQKWCDLNGKVFKTEGAAKDVAKAAREKFEDEMEEKYKSNDAFMKEIKAAVEKCEDASEGR